MAKIRIRVLEKVYHLSDCVRLLEGRRFQDTITQGVEYNGDKQILITIVNLCNKEFSVPTTVLFSDSTNGGNFEGRVESFVIRGLETKVVPLKYYGIYRGDVAIDKEYTLAFNGSENVLSLTIEKADSTLPILRDIDLTLENRESKTFALKDFTDYYYDEEDLPMKSILLDGDLSNFRLSNRRINATSVEVLAKDIEADKLSFVAPDTDSETITELNIRAKNTKDEVSI